ncbi:MAG: hypothetical protein QOG06_2442 [Gaiellaceae bacterium]|jgi:hypothetical protein|nr:hypothetical protein [Gaiellaceae bacterium]MDX6507798.1 hypothetical protein [Gaiellaceae bacterium]
MSSIQLPLDEPLSPELALVCPDLAERARHFLAEPGWAPSVRAEASARVGPLQMLALAFASIAIPATPLALLILARH